MEKEIEKLNVFGEEYVIPSGGGGSGGADIELIGNEKHTRKSVSLDAIISSPIRGSLEEGNVITLSGNLDKGVYEVKYMLADGTTANIGTVEVV